MMESSQSSHANMCKCPHHKTIPLLIVAIGAVFLLGTLEVIDMYTVHIILPILVILGGLQKLFKGMCTCC